MTDTDEVCNEISQLCLVRKDGNAGRQQIPLRICINNF